MKRIVNYFKKILGIIELEEKNKFLLDNYEKMLQRFFAQERLLKSVQADNRIIINHVKLINKDFSVAADINLSRSQRSEPSVVIVIRNFKGQENFVKTYSFDNRVMLEGIYNFLEGFSRDSVKIDKPRGLPNPKFRW